MRYQKIYFLKKEALRSSYTNEGAYFDVHHSMASSDVSVRFFGWGALTAGPSICGCATEFWTTHDKKIYSSHPASEVAITYDATLEISSSERRPPNAGIAFFPLVT
mmetsp:Transcript_10943/g.22455  ORF Transcript_10943/g.22455 Transcript_10943/m.22455 type:complete len:106 (-) Transcript_10943:373-690(-)